MCLHNTEKNVYMSISSYVSLMKFEVHFLALSRNAPFFLSAHAYPLPLEAVLVSHGALPNLQTSKRKLGVKYVCWQLIAPILSDLYKAPCTRIQVTQDGGKTLACFKYTPVKAKIKIITNTHFCVICNLDHTATLTNMLSLHIIEAKQP
jgi:hypothetical protein